MKTFMPIKSDPPNGPHEAAFRRGYHHGALAIIEAYQKQAQPNTYQDWTCPKCSEINEGQFGACWQCGYQIDERG